VEAKRYLCATDAEYLAGLSEASRLSLSLQGGPMSPEEAAEFEKHPFFDAAIRLRTCDDLGKDPDLEIPGLEHYKTRIEALAKQPATA
jgi:predicted HD phosphohydrolase